MIKKEHKNLAQFLIEQFNACVGCYCMASDEDKLTLVTVINDAGIGEVTFDKSDFAKLTFYDCDIHATVVN